MVYFSTWLINYFSQNTQYSFPVKIVNSVIIMILTIWSVYPSLVFAGWFGLSASAQTTQRETSIHQLPISQSQENFSPLLLAVNNQKNVITDDSVIATSFSFDGFDTSLAENPNPRETVTKYTVKAGDTLSGIGEYFNVSTNTIRWENGMNSNSNIKIGQTLDILPVTGVRHTIQKGDTFAKIARTYDVEIEDITIYNNIDETKLIPGNKIIIPNGIKKETQTIKEKATSIGTKITQPSSSSSNNGYYMRPASGKISSLFGPRQGSYHYGIDFAAPTGTPIVAAASGTVVKTSCGSGYGICLIIQHNNGTQTLYAHASNLFVSAGQKVKQGEKIAAVGSTGRSTGAHLHFEIIESNGKKKNSNNFFK